jgi:diguanylate cyclase (GGDEF)-like protein
VAIRDLTEKIKSERQLYTLAHFDPITHLLNRNALKKRYEDFVKSCDVDKLALFFIEIEGFKAISDQFGHEASDLLIAKQANDLQNQIELSDTLTRWGNSEFCFLQYFESDEALTRVIDDLCEFLSASKLDIEGHHVSSNYSIGVAKVEEQKPFEVLVRDADAAMFKAKSLGMNKYQVFYKDIADETLRRLRMLNELRTALANETLSFVLQGKYDKQRQLIGAEILCRWESDSFGQVSPAEFIPLIEQHGMESKLGLLAIKQAAIFSKSLNQFGLNIAISVNVSSPQIMDEGFLDDIIDICDRHGVEHQYIELEITESVFMFEDQNPSAILRDIQQAGFRISLDDFGTGYSSLSYLQQFQFDVVKVDRSFILELEDNERAYNLFLAIMNMCKALKTDTVVEGIETEEQFSILYKAGVNKFQGFLLGRPILLEDFLKDNLH